MCHLEVFMPADYEKKIRAVSYDAFFVKMHAIYMFIVNRSGF